MLELSPKIGAHCVPKLNVMLPNKLTSVEIIHSEKNTPEKVSFQKYQNKPLYRGIFSHVSSVPWAMKLVQRSIQRVCSFQPITGVALTHLGSCYPDTKHTWVGLHPLVGLLYIHQIPGS